MAITAPTGIANCSLWLKADTGITQAVTGRVSAWADQSGAGNNFVQATTTLQPHIYDDPIFGKRVAFNPTEAQPHFLASSLPVNTQSFSIFIVHRTANAVSSNVIPLFNNSTGAGNGALLNFNYIPCVYNGGAIRYSTKLMNSMLDVTGYCAGASDVDLYVNHTKTTLAALTSESTTYASLGRWNSDSSTYLGDIVEVFAYSRKLTSGEQTDVLDYLRLKHGIVQHTVNVVLLGDSISQGVGATESRTLPMFLEKQIPRTVRLMNQGRSGWTWNQILAGVPAETVVAGQRNIVIGFAGTNDIADGDSPAQTNTDRIAVYAPYLAGGWETMSVHMLPRETGLETLRNTYNALLSASTTESAVATYANYPELGSGFLVNGLTADQIHPTSAGYGVLARPIGETLTRLLNRGADLADLQVQANALRLAVYG